MSVGRKCLSIFLILLASGMLVSRNARGASCKIIFRFDDYPGANLEVQKAVISLFREKEIPLTVAAMPALLKDNAEAIEFLVKSAGPKCEIALHGWDHSDRLLGTTPSEKSEFVGLSIDEQYATLMQGVSVFKECLGLEPWTFVPPFNTYDTNTVEALQKAGIKCLSADIGRREVNHSNLAYVPETCLLKDIAETEDLTEGIYVVMFHDYDFVETGSHNAYFSLKDLDFLLTRLAAQPNMEFSNIASITRNRPDDFGAARLDAGHELVAYPGTRLFAFPAHWVRAMPKTYQTADVYTQLLRRASRFGLGLDLLGIMGVVIIAVSTFGLLRWLRRQGLWRRRAAWALPIGSLLLIGVVCIANLSSVAPVSSGLGYKDRIALAILAAGALGGLSSCASWKDFRGKGAST